jgi:hypothetical protein
MHIGHPPNSQVDSTTDIGRSATDIAGAGSERRSPGVGACAKSAPHPPKSNPSRERVALAREASRFPPLTMTIGFSRRAVTAPAVSVASGRPLGAQSIPVQRGKGSPDARHTPAGAARDHRAQPPPGVSDGAAVPRRCPQSGAFQRARWSTRADRLCNQRRQSSRALSGPWRTRCAGCSARSRALHRLHSIFIRPNQ